jgi:hypothetical protein
VLVVLLEGSPEMTMTTDPTPTTRSDLVDRAASGRAHRAWLDLVDGIVQGCPAPQEFRVHLEASVATLSVFLPAHVQAWAMFLGADTINERVWIHTDPDGTRRRLTCVDARLRRAGELTVHVEYLASVALSADYVETATDTLDSRVDLATGERS